MIDKVTLIKEDDEVTGFTINGKEFYAEDGLVDVEVEDLKGFNLSSIPEGFLLHLFDGYYDWFIQSNAEHVGIAEIENHIYRKYWDHKFGALEYVNAMEKAVKIRNNTNKDVEADRIEDDGAHIFFHFCLFLNDDVAIEIAYNRFHEILQEIEGHTERLLEGEEIPNEVLRNENEFVVGVLLPLFRSMGFIDVKYNHGKREFGKDVTFSEIDKFGVRQNYGAQVKAGDLSGEAGSEIDKIIAQIDDAFKIPYIDTTSREKRFISDLIIAISGRFTNNAEDKIIEKVHQRNIYFLSKDKIQELLTAHMKKTIK